jgi:peptidoglycan/xylan/chitin deacetylase (PgdA/CDA1 family)
MNTWDLFVPPIIASCGLLAWGAYHPASQLLGPTTRRTGRASTLALTFDDGPNPAATPYLLDLLDRHKARATFFLIGERVRLYPRVAAAIVARGHVVGNHTDTHPSLVWLGPAQIGAELSRCQEEIRLATGRRPLWMRPPFGFRGPQLNRVVRRMGFTGVAMWSLTAYDWNPQPPARLIQRLARVRGGDIVLLHDGDSRSQDADRSHVIGALAHWLPRWRDDGLEFVALDEVKTGSTVPGQVPAL